MERIEIKVPGTFASGAYLDLETTKVPTGGFRMRNGENLKNRWSVIMAGIAHDGRIGILDAEGDENSVLAAIADELSGEETVIYGATREFDEMICKGRFTNARRAHEPIAFFPAVPKADELTWRNVGTTKSDARRGTDVPSRDVPRAYATGDRSDWYDVAVHLLRDVADLILIAGNPDEKCAKWCRNVLVSYGFAKAEIDEA